MDNELEHLARHYRADWMTDDQWECTLFVADLFQGFHHVMGEFKKMGTGIQINVANGNWCATYDYDGLTRAVIMAHDRMVRFEIRPSGPNRLRLCLWKRHVRDGKMHERHPTIEDAIKKWRIGGNPA